MTFYYLKGENEEKGKWHEKKKVQWRTKEKMEKGGGFSIKRFRRKNSEYVWKVME